VKEGKTGGKRAERGKAGKQASRQAGERETIAEKRVRRIRSGSSLAGREARL